MVAIVYGFVAPRSRLRHGFVSSRDDTDLKGSRLAVARASAGTDVLCGLQRALESQIGKK